MSDAEEESWDANDQAEMVLQQVENTNNNVRGYVGTRLISDGPRIRMERSPAQSPRTSRRPNAVVLRTDDLQLPTSAWANNNNNDPNGDKSPSSPYQEMLRQNLLEGRKPHDTKPTPFRPQRRSEQNEPETSLLDPKPLSGSSPDLPISSEDEECNIRTFIPDNVDEIQRMPLPSGSQTFRDAMREFEEENMPSSEGPKRKKKISVSKSPNFSPSSSPRLDRKLGLTFKSKDAQSIVTKIMMNPNLKPGDLDSPRTRQRSSVASLNPDGKDIPARRYSDRPRQRPSVESGLIIPDKHKNPPTRRFSDRALVRPTVEAGLVIPERHLKAMPTSPLAVEKKRPLRVSLSGAIPSQTSSRSPRSGSDSPLSPSSPRFLRRSQVKPPSVH